MGDGWVDVWLNVSVGGWLLGGCVDGCFGRWMVVVLMCGWISR